jgi:hypothetical protein
MYKCKECSKAIIIIEGKQIRICDCTKPDGTPSTIILDMEANAKGLSNIKL